jgi:hypothetical protein
MFTAQQLTGPVAPGQMSPMQVSGPGAYYPTQTTDPFSGMFTSMMPMIMMIMMFEKMKPRVSLC